MLGMGELLEPNWCIGFALKWFTFCLTIYTFCVRVIGKDIWKTSSIFLLYYFSLNGQNYARNLSYCCVYMWALEEENIAAYKYLEQGGFSGSLTGKPHSRIPFDQVIKMTINRSCKDIGGLSETHKILVQQKGGQEYIIIWAWYCQNRTRWRRCEEYHNKHRCMASWAMEKKVIL